MYILNYKIIS